MKFLISGLKVNDDGVQVPPFSFSVDCALAGLDGDGMHIRVIPMRGPYRTSEEAMEDFRREFPKSSGHCLILEGDLVAVQPATRHQG